MNNSVRLGVEAVLVIVLIIALFLYFSQQQQLTDTQAVLDNANATVTSLASANEAQAADLTGLADAVASAEAAAEEQSYAAATAMANNVAVQEQSDAAQGTAIAAQESASAAQASAEAAALEQANVAATAIAEAEAAAAQVAEAQAAADSAATAQVNAESAAQAVAQQSADLQATIEALNAAASAVTPEPEATEAVEATEAEVTEAVEPTEAVEVTEEAASVVGFNYPEVFTMALDASYTPYDLTGDNREASLSAIAAADADLGTRLTRESAHDYAAWQAAGEYVLVNQQTLPAGVDSAADVARVAFRRATSSEVLTLGENEVARGWFGDDEVRYIIVDGGSMWVITFHSADAAANLAAFDAAVATFNAPEPPAEE
jgi:hypothetical protein